MKTSPKGIELIKHFEGCKLEAYICPAGKPTIGWGTTSYPNGREIKLGDVCTEEQAEEYLINDLSLLEKKIDRHFGKLLNQNQFDALVSFSYNLGFGNLLSSTLRRKILNNVNDDAIGIEFMKWCHVGKVKSSGLLRRRKSEYTLYSTGELKFYENDKV